MPGGASTATIKACPSTVHNAMNDSLGWATEPLGRWANRSSSTTSASTPSGCATSASHSVRMVSSAMLNSHLTSRSVCIFLARLVYIPELSLIPRQVPDFNEQTRVSNGHPRCNSRIYPRFLPQPRKPMRLSPPCEMRPDSPALCPEQLRFPNQTRKEPRFA